jgi:YidC/Oxa1 family membrane protein insertase
MEYRRIILAIALSFLVFLAYDLLFGPEKPVQTPQQSEPVTDQAPDKSAEETPYIQESAPVSRIPEEAPPQEIPAQKSERQPARTITVETPLYTARISEDAAAFVGMVLKNFRESANGDAAPKQLVADNISDGTVTLTAKNNALPGLEHAVFTAQTETDSLQVQSSPSELVFSWQTDRGVVVEKTYRFDPQSYLIGLRIALKNGSTQSITEQLGIVIRNPYEKDRRAIGFHGPSALINNSLEEIDVDDLEDQNRFEGKIQWIGNQTRYFLSGLIPKEIVDTAMQVNMKGETIIENQYLLPETVFNPGTQKAFEFNVFQGPKSMRLLSDYNNGLEKAVDFGMFDILAKPCLWLMNFIYDHVVPNYGIAIIILTLITKVILWPLGTKSYKSMSEMKKLQPLVQQLKEKYKNDRKKLNEETMALYRTYKINPLGGCLPMVVQIPVFIALYRMLYEAIELRHAPFFLWINDLSAPDRLLRFGFSIPFMEPPYGIPVLTLVMGASMFLQQKMSPPMGDTAQAKMMLFMPIIFTVIFINFSSGLVLYWLTNNLVSIAQQFYTQKKLA